MAKVRASRRIERAGVNALRTLLENHDHLVQEIDGGADHGEDIFVIFTRNRRRTGYVVAIQVKSGKKYKRSNGYAIPVGDHADDWRRSKIPVLGVVYDPESGELFWVNLTKILNEYSTALSWIPVPRENRLDDGSMRGFIALLESYIDDEGMRVQRESVAVMLEKAIRARKSGRIGYEANETNPLFEPYVDVALKYERTLKKLLRYAPLVALTGIMIVEWPYQVRFVETYSNLIPAIWILNVYFFTYLLMLTVFFEFRAGRVPRFAGHILTLILVNFYVNPFFIGDGKEDAWWGDVWIFVGVFMPTFGYKFMMFSYVQDALDRRRKRAKASEETP